MKRLVMLSAACALLASAYAVRLRQQRRLLAEERSLKLQIWETEGGSPGDRTSPNPTDTTYS